MLTAKQRELLLLIDDRLKTGGISPSFDEMRDALGLKSKSGVHRLISALEERGFIRRLPNRARALEVLKLPEAAPAPVTGRPVVPSPANDTIEIPLHGRIAAGTPIEALQGTEGFAVPAALLGPADLKGASQTSCSVLRDLGPEIQWVHSYVTDDKIYCIYRAPNEDIIREHAARGGFPANKINRVRTVIDPTTAE
jgi:hypothetical protein